MNRLANDRVDFRTLRRSDAPDFADMVFALYRDDPCGERMSQLKIRRTIEEFERRPDKGRITLFWIDGEAAGYAITVYLWSNEFGGDIAVLDELYVKPPWRGQGIAGRFLSHMAHGNQTGLKGIQLEVTPDNERAMAFYRRRGFAAAPNRHLFRKLG